MHVLNGICFSAFTLTVAACLVGQRADGAATFAELDPQRVERISAMLPAQPAGFGKPIEDRQFWSGPQVRPLTGKAVKDAEKLLAKPFPAWDDALYLDFSKTGQRPAGEKMLKARDNWLFPLVIGLKLRKPVSSATVRVTLKAGS